MSTKTRLSVDERIHYSANEAVRKETLADEGHFVCTSFIHRNRASFVMWLKPGITDAELHTKLDARLAPFYLEDVAAEDLEPRYVPDV